MATWNLTIDNRANASTTVYIMEDDGSGLITTPEDLFYPLCFLDKCNSNLAQRFYASLAIGGDDFPPVCKSIAARGTGALKVSKDTRALKVWTYKDGVWNIRPNITENISDGAAIVIPPYTEEEERR